MKKRLWVVGILLGVAVACQPRPTEKEATPVNTQSAPTATLGATPTFQPLETNTPFPTNAIPATLTPRPTGFAPRAVGGSNLGLEITVPGTWVEAGNLLTSRQREALGLQRLFYADSQATAMALLGGERIGNGAFVLGYVDVTESVTTEPAAELLSFLQVVGIEGGNPLTVRTNDGQTGAYVDLDVDPLGHFPAPAEPLRWRLALFVQPQSGAPALFQFGASAATWESYKPLFDEMLETVSVYEPPEVFPGLGLPAVIQGSLMPRDMVISTLSVSMLDVWTFHTEAGNYATISLRPRSEELDLTFALIAPSGQTVSNADIGYAGDTEILTDIFLEEAGEYLIVVREFFGAGGQYQLSLLLTETAQFGAGGPIVIGEVLMNTLPGNEEQVWTFSGTAGQIVSIILNPTEDSFDAVLTLRDPTGNVLLSLDEGFSGDAEVISSLSLPITGQYTIHVTGFSGSGGPYTLSLAEGSEDTANFYDAGDLLYGATRSESLRSNEAHAWFFNGIAGDQVEIIITPLANDLDLHAWLLDPDTERLAERDEFLAGRPERIAYTLPVDGQFIILVREYTGRAGDYQISLTLRGNEDAVYGGVISYGQTVNGSVAGGQSTLWYFNAQQGEEVLLTLTPAGEAGLMLLLRDPAGNVTGRLESGQSQPLTFTATGSGTWSIAVRNTSTGSTDYTLTLQLLE